MSDRIPLCVPAWASAQAFRTNARYEKDYGFYILSSDSDDDVWEWLPKKYLGGREPALLPDMLPVTAWEDNVRTLVRPERWDRLRRYCYQAAGHRCEICGEKGAPYLECHEEWVFDEVQGLQRLKRLFALCTLCHKAKHLGFARSAGILGEVKAKMLDVNGWDQSRLDEEMCKAEARWRRLSGRTWRVDTSWLVEYNVR